MESRSIIIIIIIIVIIILHFVTLNLLISSGEPCVKMHAPINGEMNCTGNTTAHVCYFKCLPGYKLLGSTSRNCSGNNTWTSEETTCKSKSNIFIVSYGIIPAVIIGKYLL